MFDSSQGAIDHALEREREACRRELLSNAELRARLDQRDMQLPCDADDRGDWKAAGCPSRAQWLAQLSRIDYGTAKRITDTSETLRTLPALNAAMGTVR